MKNKILYVEDDKTLSFLTKDQLELEGFDVAHYLNGQEALKDFQKKHFDICVLDVMLPLMDGFTLAEEIRKINDAVPIIFLTAKSMQEDKIRGLKLGADDYISKPFSMEELVLKVKIFLKRKGIDTSENNHFTLGIFQYDHKNLKLTSKDTEDKLTAKEGELLKFLITHPDQILKREMILKNLWGENDYFLGRSMDVFISRLRKYLKPDNTLKIETIHGVGFRLNTNLGEDQ